MRPTCFKIALPPAALSIALLGASAAMAAPEPSQGDTSGPAAGTHTAQSAAVQKNANQWNDGRSDHAGRGNPMRHRDLLRVLSSHNKAIGQ